MIDLSGTIDLHVHSAPDIYPRLLDDLEVVLAAEKAGMRGVLLKSHHTLTADRATLVEQHTKIAVRGGLALNLPVGGLNPVAVETAIGFGARQIWMPTIHASHCLRTAEAEMFAAEARKGYEGITPFDEEGNPVASLGPILEMIRDADVTLGTGHLAPEESLALIKLAREMNLSRVLVTHPLMSFTRFSLDQMKQACSWGAVLEFDALSCNSKWPKSMPATTTAQAIVEVGPRNCVLASDGGQTWNPAAPSMLLAFAEELSKCGVADDALRCMLQDNPAYLIGL